MLLACGIPDRLASQLRDEGVAVSVLDAEPSLGNLAEAALQLRKRDPYLRLFVVAPKRLIRRFERDYPALSDETYGDDAAHRWFSVLSASVPPSR